MKLVIVRDLKLGKIYKELQSKFIGRLTEKCLIVNTERFNQRPYYDLEFITKPKEKIFVVKEWNDKFIEMPNDKGIPDIDSNNDQLMNKKEKVYYLIPKYKVFIPNMNK